MHIYSEEALKKFPFLRLLDSALYAECKWMAKHWSVEKCKTAFLLAIILLLISGGFSVVALGLLISGGAHKIILGFGLLLGAGIFLGSFTIILTAPATEQLRIDL